MDRESKALKLVSILDNSLGRKRNRLMQNDRPGLSYAKFGGLSPHKLDGGKNPHEQNLDQFAKHISEFLDHEYRKRNFDTVVLTAEPHFLGILRTYLNGSEFPIQWLNKDLAKFPLGKLKSNLQICGIHI